MSIFIGYPKIGQYRDVIRGLCRKESFIGLDENNEPIFDSEKLLPHVKFTGTVKLHGTNAGIGNLGDEVWFQSRTSIITPISDNHGFAASMSTKTHIDWIKKTFKELREKNNIADNEIVVIFGERCGGNIQQGVALTELDKRFVIFDIRVVGEERNDDGNYTNDRWLSIEGISNHDLGVYNILDYQHWTVDVNLNIPDTVLNKLDEITTAVGKQCPFAKAFGVDGIGEGVVGSSIHDGCRYAFKVKDDSHKNVKTKNKKTSLDPEKVSNVNEFVEYSLTENRLNQAIEQVFTGPGIEPTVKQTGTFLKWIVNDIVTEEIDTLASNDLSAKDVNGVISKKAREWYFEYLDKIVFGEGHAD